MNQWKFVQLTKKGFSGMQNFFSESLWLKFEAIWLDFPSCRKVAMRVYPNKEWRLIKIGEWIIFNEYGFYKNLTYFPEHPDPFTKQVLS